MRDKIKTLIQVALNKRTHYFMRELDIQIYLASYLLESQLFKNVFVEYHIPRDIVKKYPWKDANNIYVDIVVQTANKFYPIEIKYKSKFQVIKQNIFGGTCEMILRNHGAKNIGCYDFWKDVRRCELFEANFKNTKRGIVVFVTNDEKYLHRPTNEKVGYANFSIHQGRKVEANSKLKWNGELATSVKRPPILIQNQIELSWFDFEHLDKHKFLII